MAPSINSTEVATQTALLREQIVDLEDKLIELSTEAGRLASAASAREAFVTALRQAPKAPLAIADDRPAPREPTVAIEADVAGSNATDETFAAFFSNKVDDEPARAWLLSKKQ